MNKFNTSQETREDLRVSYAFCDFLCQAQYVEIPTQRDPLVRFQNDPHFVRFHIAARVVQLTEKMNIFVLCMNYSKNKEQ